MSDCPSSDKIQGAKIPELVCTDAVPASALRLPTEYPSVMNAANLFDTYELTPADLQAQWKPTYYQITNGVASTSDDECTNNTNVTASSYTWVDWLSAVESHANGRDWVHTPECSDTGGTSGISKGPSRPTAALPDTVALPTPSMLVSKTTGGGGGGTVVVKQQDLAFQMVTTGMQLQIRPGRVYIHDNIAKSVCFQYGSFSAAQDCVIKGYSVPVAFSSLDNATYLVIGYVAYNATRISDYGVLIFADTRDLYRFPNLPGFFCWVIGRVSKNRNKLTIVEQEHCFSVFVDSYLLSQSFSLHFLFDLGDTTQLKYVTNAFRTPIITLSGGSIWDSPTRITTINGITYENGITSGRYIYAVLNRYSYTMQWTTENPLTVSNTAFLLLARVGYQTTSKVDYQWKLNHPADLLYPPRYAGYFTIISTDTGYRVIDGAGSGNSICRVNGSTFTVANTTLEESGQYVLLVYQAPYPSGVEPPNDIKYGVYLLRSAYANPSSLGIRYCAYKQIGRIMSSNGIEYIQQDHMAGIPEIMYFSRSCVSSEIEDEPESSSTNE